MKNSTIDDGSFLRVGPAAFTQAGTVVFHRYLSGEIGIEIVSDDGESRCVATVALLPYGAPDPGKYGVWLKGWTENKGVPEALVAAGIVTLTGRTHRTGFCEAQHAELTERAQATLVRHEARAR